MSESTPSGSDRDLELAHVLFVDVVGYSKTLVDEQRETLRELNAIVRQTEQFRKADAQQKLICLPTGDGMALAFFTTPEAPVRCAIEMARALQNHPEIQLRMGVHTGPVNTVADVNERANVAGAGINMAQRVMDCGDAGHILLSQRVAEDLGQSREWSPLLHDLGECEVKHGTRVHLFNFHGDDFGNAATPTRVNLGRRSHKKRSWLMPVAIGAVVLLVLGLVSYQLMRSKRLPSSTAVVPEKSIAVLPFENLSEDKGNAYFAEGMQDEILTRLSKIADLKVISRTSTVHYKSAPENLTEIARQLGVAHILEGSVQKSGDAVRVNVQLIKAANDSHLWADTFDRKLTDIFSVESEVAKAIAEQLRAHLTAPEEQVIAARPTDNLEAYDAYLRGLAYNLKTTNTPPNALGAQKYLREAVRLDPKFALSWALLSYVDSGGYLTLTLQHTVALREEARQAVETALSLQPNLGEAVLAKGFYYYACLKDYDTATQYYEQARQFLPNSSRIEQSLAYVARRQGQWDRSESYFKQAEPLDPRNVNLLTRHALSYYALRRFPEALRKLDEVLNITPEDVDTIVEKAAIAQAEGDLPRAAALLNPLHPAPDDVQALEGQVYQAILERRPAPIILRLKEVLAKPSPALGYLNGELRFWLGWAQDVTGDHAAAEESWQQARSELESFLEEQPENYALLGDLALTDVGLGDKAAAFRLAERAMVVNPTEKDAFDGPASLEILARVAAQTGEPDRAMAALQKLLSIPYEGPLTSSVPLTPALLRLDPMFDPLRTDPRFQKLCEEKKP